jgi:RNA polymerase sigma factor (sigma-70 family)
LHQTTKLIVGFSRRAHTYHRMQPADDNALLRQFVESQSDGAFAELVERHVNLVYSVALRQVGRPADAEEITQAVFIILAKKAETLRHDKAISSWLFQTTRLTANNFIRSEMRRHRREQEAFMQPALNEPEDAVWQKIGPLLDDAVTALGEQDRRAILLRFYEGRNLREVGAGLGASEDAAEKRVSRALEKLRKFFFKRGVDSTTAALAGSISSNSIQTAPADLAKTISAVALAKGAAASTSTLTLAHGALKLMAWTKTKTTLVGVAIALLGIGTTAVVVDALLPAPNIQGTWEGMLTVAQAAGYGVHKGETPRYPIILKISGGNGAYQVQVDDLGFGNQEQLATCTYRYPTLIGHSTVSDRNFVGTVDSSGKKMTGKILQLPDNTVVATAVFLRTNNPTPYPEALTDAEFAPRPGSDLQGFWAGKIGGGKSALRIRIKIAETDDGTFRADFYSQGTVRQPTTVSYDGSVVKLMPMNGFGMFEGQLRNRGKEMTGEWLQGGYHTAATLIQTNYSEYNSDFQAQ